MPIELAEWQELYDKGRPDFVIYMPVITRSSRFKGPPSGIASSQIAMKDFDKLGGTDMPTGAPADWASVASSWLKTGDNYTYDGKWYSREEEWTGAADWPDLLYTPAPLKQENNNSN